MLQSENQERFAKTDMGSRLSIRIRGRYASLGDLDWEGIPPLAVITGLNGVGKSQLLEVVAHSLGKTELIPADPTMIDPQWWVLIKGDKFRRSEVFHSYGEWDPLTSAPVYEEHIRAAIHDLQAERRTEDLLEVLARDLRVDVQGVRDLTPPQFKKLLTPAVLWTYTTSKFRNLSFLFLAYRMFERDAIEAGETLADARTRFGEPPWDLMSAIISAAGLAFSVNEPPPLQLFRRERSNERFEIELRDFEGNLVPLDRLSSGERVLMSTATWRYEAETSGIHYRLLLLDEPDAHLHPSLTRSFLKIISDVFVKERNVRVIMTTHSPSTVALTPEESLFEMRRSEPRIRPVGRAEAIANLSGGFVAVQDATRTVLLEGKTDPLFYRLVWQLLVSWPTTAETGLLNPYPNINFVHGQGRQTVQALIPQLRRGGFTNFFGIIDRDAGNVAGDGVFVLARYAVENYLYDPLNVWFYLHSLGKATAIAGQDLTAPMRSWKTDSLQQVVDIIVKEVELHFPPRSEEESRRGEVVYSADRVLRYPLWCLTRAKSEIKSQFARTFFQFPAHEILAAYGELNMVPADIVDLYGAIQAEQHGC